MISMIRLAAISWTQHWGNLLQEWFSPSVGWLAISIMRMSNMRMGVEVRMVVGMKMRMVLTFSRLVSNLYHMRMRGMMGMGAGRIIQCQCRRDLRATGDGQRYLPGSQTR